ncbi:YTH domain-containing family protein 1-like isoform X1 [Asparagus officinalis]|uniref:YTH domain-containing family protein 1-like isoform X1 n=2 Tax=Asparagus officinalis TaxID=4686 RepID=UPI00098E0129|nr:YTH domain-containing family protein 1-like isoform X1 [Asparagus officinalis]XP_020265988.1 YTH domain-containing family protein 1-like isoform X2 [Asparagus officinalis]XP_020265989.1 YTH domain-containing family protein 1-like isoform X1 [Asparagus officinalis]
MEMYNGSDNGPTETYMMPGTVPNPQLTLFQPLEGVDYITNEVAPEVTYEQGLYYPATNYYGYYSTGLEPQREWVDQQRFFGLDGQELHYAVLQTESSPYVYYSPSYGYAQPSYNPYNPYSPCAAIGLDGSNIGTQPQPYFSDPSYQLPISSPAAYIPVILQPHSDAAPNISMTPTVLGSISSSRQVTANSKSKSCASSNGGATSQGTASRILKSELSGSSTPGQGRTPGLTQVTDSHGSVSSVQNPSKVPSVNFPQNFGSTVHGWTTVDRLRPRFQFNAAVKNGSGNSDFLGEQNRGPRTNRLKGQPASASTIGLSISKAGGNNAQEAIIIRADQYNKDDFPLDHPDAKFFVIKSYSEDDVHKSIKYNVWSSTPNGNKRLNSAYEDAQRISTGKVKNCPIFLFFSVNASGQFCGVAEMTGPVDFDNDMDFWQQDKWTGSFPVKWHIIKDAPNTSFRQILLENNENKPVTNSRDTQEIMYAPGMSMLNIFKDSPLSTSILDDFMFYEERQKIMQEEKSRFTGRSYKTYIPAIVSAEKSSDSAGQSGSSDQIAKGDGGQASVTSGQPLNADVELTEFKHNKSSGSDGPIELDALESLNAVKDLNPDKKEDANYLSSVMKMKSLPLCGKEDETEAIMKEKSTQSDVVTVGSMHIKVNGTAEAASEVTNIGSTIESKTMKLDDNKGPISEDSASLK